MDTLIPQKKVLLLTLRFFSLSWNDDFLIRTYVLSDGFSAGDVYFDIQSIGDRYGKFVGAVGSQGESGKCSCLLVFQNGHYPRRRSAPFSHNILCFLWGFLL